MQASAVKFSNLPEDHPSVVLWFSRSLPNVTDGYGIGCSSTMIANNVLFTASHCLTNLEPEQEEIFIYLYSPVKNATYGVISHDWFKTDYNRSSMDAANWQDYGLIFFDYPEGCEASDFVHMPLAPQGIYDHIRSGLPQHNKPGFVSGYTAFNRMLNTKGMLYFRPKIYYDGSFGCAGYAKFIGSYEQWINYESYICIQRHAGARSGVNGGTVGVVYDGKDYLIASVSESEMHYLPDQNHETIISEIEKRYPATAEQVREQLAETIDDMPMTIPKMPAEAMQLVDPCTMKCVDIEKNFIEITPGVPASYVGNEYQQLVLKECDKTSDTQKWYLPTPDTTQENMPSAITNKAMGGLDKNNCPIVPLADDVELRWYIGKGEKHRPTMAVDTDFDVTPYLRLVMLTKDVDDEMCSYDHYFGIASGEGNATMHHYWTLWTNYNMGIAANGAIYMSAQSAVMQNAYDQGGNHMADYAGCLVNHNNAVEMTMDTMDKRCLDDMAIKFSSNLIQFNGVDTLEIMGGHTTKLSRNFARDMHGRQTSVYFHIPEQPNALPAGTASRRVWNGRNVGGTVIRFKLTNMMTMEEFWVNGKAHKRFYGRWLHMSDGVQSGFGTLGIHFHDADVPAGQYAGEFYVIGMPWNTGSYRAKVNVKISFTKA